MAYLSTLLIDAAMPQLHVAGHKNNINNSANYITLTLRLDEVAANISIRIRPSALCNIYNVITWHRAAAPHINNSLERFHWNIEDIIGYIYERGTLRPFHNVVTGLDV